jgi:hypothetical protein
MSDPSGSFSLNDMVIDPEAGDGADTPLIHTPGHGLPRPGDLYPWGDDPTVIDPEAPERPEGGQGGQDGAGAGGGDAPLLDDVLLAEKVWKARVGLIGAKAREREERDRIKLVEGGGRAKPPVADPTPYEEHERHRREVMAKLERQRAQKRRRR